MLKKALYSFKGQLSFYLWGMASPWLLQA